MNQPTRLGGFRYSLLTIKAMKRPRKDSCGRRNLKKQAHDLINCTDVRVRDSQRRCPGFEVTPSLNIVSIDSSQGAATISLLYT